MKVSKLFSAVVIASAMLATVADAGSIGRSGGGGGRSSSSFSSSSSMSRSSSFSQPSKPAVAPATAPATRPGGIGGANAGSAFGVRKSEVTAPVAQQVRPTTPAPSSVSSYSGSHPTTSSGYSAPHYSSPAPVVVQSGGGFGSTFMGAMTGSMVGNALFGNHGNGGGGTTVINNGTPSGGTVSSGSVAPAQSADSGYASNGIVYTQPPKKEYTVWSFIADLIGFVFVVAILLGIAWLFYKGFQMVRTYVNKERGVSNQPFNPTQQFWTIQKAFSKADETALQGLLGPDIVDELVNSLQPSELTLFNVSHEVRLANNTEFSVWYKFKDNDEEVNQVWHYEKFGKDWKLNGIETV